MSGGLIAQLGYTLFRNFVTDGVEGSGSNPPSKVDGRAFAYQIDAAISDMAMFNTPGINYATRASLFADLVHPANTLGLVYNDNVSAAYNGIYVKVGASGAGSWTFTGIALASSIAALVAELEAAAPWYNTSFAQVAQLKQALAASFLTVQNAVPLDPTSAVTQQWTSGGMCTQAGPLGAFIKATLGFSDAQMTTLFAAAVAEPY
jgi:hypothetical protein